MTVLAKCFKIGVGDLGSLKKGLNFSASNPTWSVTSWNFERSLRSRDGGSADGQDRYSDYRNWERIWFLLGAETVVCS